MAIEPRSRSRRGAIAQRAIIAAITVFATWASLGAGLASAGADTKPLTPPEQIAFAINSLGNDGFGPEGTAAKIRSTLADAMAEYDNGDPCGAVDSISIIVATSRAIEPPSARRLIFAAAWNARTQILSEVSGRSECHDPTVGREPKLRLKSSSIRGLSARVLLGAPELTPTHHGKQHFTEVTLPGLYPDIDALGRPTLPVVRELIALPQGARVQVASSWGDGSIMPAIPEPVQPEAEMGAVDEYHEDQPPPASLFAQPKFVFKSKVYAGRELYPSGKPCTVDPIGLYREIRLAVVECVVARFDRGSDRVRVYPKVSFDVRFTGGDGTFAPRRGGNPFQGKGKIQMTAPINSAEINQHLGPADLTVNTCPGEELMILTHADLLADAQDMADWKNTMGIPTRVFTVNDGAGPRPDTVEEIRQLIRKQYLKCDISPSYVMLFGDAEWVPTDYLPQPGSPDAGYIATDWSYTQLVAPPGQIGPQPLGWQFAVGRIPVDPPQAAAVVDKLTGYEQNPPSSLFEDFYGQAGIASQFDCCNFDTDPGTGDPVAPDGTDRGWFIGTVEDLRDGLTGEGYSVDRIYQKTLSGSYTGDPTPLYTDGAMLPSDLLPPFAWNGSNAGVIDAFNDGRSIMIHLDHGWSGGWSTPNFDKYDAAALTNDDELAFVLSYNCSSGYFDNETDGPPNDPNADTDPTTSSSFMNWAEEIIRNPNGGAMGTIAATRTTYGHGNIMMRGALDSAFPNIDSSFGSGYANRRIGDMLNQARLYMADQYGAGTTTRLHWYLYNLHGDPTAELWTKIPFKIRIPKLVDRRPKFILIQHPVDGTVLTAWQRTANRVRAIGRATVHDGEARIAYFERPLDGPDINISAGAPNGIGAVVAEIATD